MPKKVKNIYKPSETITAQEKSVWTERKLQVLQKELFKQFKKCRKSCKKCSSKECETCDIRPCSSCVDRVCEPLIEQMVKFLTPYGVSIFKRSFKRRATCEEMDRIVPESVNSLMIDVWHKKKQIHTSFGSMLKWKIVYFLDGNINLFDSDRYLSIDQFVHDKMPNVTSHDDNAENLIECLSEEFKSAIFTNATDREIYRKETIDSILELVESSIQTYNKFLPYKQRYSIYIRTIHALNRFLKHRDADSVFKDNSKAQFYYVQLLDAIKKYLYAYAKLN